MKMKLLLLLFSGCFSLNAFGQCSGGTAFGTITPSTSWQTFGNLYAGQYLVFNGTAGSVYCFSLCSVDGGSASYDSEITILDNSGNYAGGYNNDSCGQQSFVKWSPASNGTYRVLINEFSCLTNTTSTTLAYKILVPPPAPCYSVNSIPYSAEPDTGSSLLVNIDDSWSGVIPIGFNFCFFGTNYSQCLVGSNEVISFNIANANAFNTWAITAALPSAGTADMLNTIMAPWQDVDPSLTGTIKCYNAGTAPYRRFVVTFSSIPMFQCNTSISTSQVVLYETSNAIEIQLLDKPLCATWNGGYAIEGIQDPAGTSAFVVSGRNYPTQWTATSDGYKFVPTCPPCGVATSMDDASGWANEISVFPNPASGKFNLKMNQFESWRIEDAAVYNIYGEKIYWAVDFQINRSSDFQIDLKDAPTGIYFLRLETAQGIFTKKMVVSK